MGRRKTDPVEAKRCSLCEIQSNRWYVAERQRHLFGPRNKYYDWLLGDGVKLSRAELDAVVFWGGAKTVLSVGAFYVTFLLLMALT